jgi:hypothetical protein
LCSTSGSIGSGAAGCGATCVFLRFLGGTCDVAVSCATSGAESSESDDSGATSVFHSVGPSATASGSPAVSIVTPFS